MYMYNKNMTRSYAAESFSMATPEKVCVRQLNEYTVSKLQT